MGSLLLYRDTSVAVVLTDSKAAKRGDMPAVYVYGRNGKVDACPTSCGMYDKGCYARSGREGLLERNAWSFAVVSGPLATTAQIRSMIRGRHIRSAAIGDLGMVPVDIVSRLVAAGSAGIIGYTHTDSAALRSSHMRSVETMADALSAWSTGRRTFRVLAAGSETWKGHNAFGEVACPAWSTDGRVTCDRCKLCDGDNSKPSVAIAAHGTQARSIAG
jgi:hypothetical protein